MLYSIISRVRVSPSTSTMCCRWAVSMALGENLQVVMNSPFGAAPVLEGAAEFVDLRPGDDGVRRPALGLEVDLAEAQLVLLDDPVNAPVAGAAGDNPRVLEGAA